MLRISIGFPKAILTKYEIDILSTISANSATGHINGGKKYQKLLNSSTFTGLEAPEDTDFWKLVKYSENSHYIFALFLCFCWSHGWRQGAGPPCLWLINDSLYLGE